MSGDADGCARGKTLRQTPGFGLYVGIASGILMAVVLGLLCTSWGTVRGAWSRNMQNVSLAREAHGECSGFASASGVLCSSEKNGWIGEWLSNDLAPCQRLWASRLQASRSLESAREAFGQSMDCARQPLVIAWGGQLAWLQNDRQLARQWWRKMGTAELVGWGYALLLDGGIEQGEFLLELAVERDGERTERFQGAEALFKLGHAHRMRGDWSQAADRYEAAHRLVPESVEFIFYLGMSYRQIGQPEKAASILEEGLDHLPINWPEFVSDYFVQLGLAYRESGSAVQAVTAFQQAQEWLDKLRTPHAEQEGFIQDLLDGPPGSPPDQTPRTIDANP